MKPFLTLSLFALMAIFADLTAQKPIVLSEDSLTYGAAKYPGIAVSIPEVSFDRTEKNWIRELQSGTKSKVVYENGEMSIFGAIIKDISPNPLNIYSRLISQDSLIRLLVSFEVKKDQFIEKATGDAELQAARSFLKEFGKGQYVDFVKDELKVEEKKLSDLNNELNSLRNEKSKMQKSIQSNRTTITESRDNIVLLNNEVTKLTTEITTQTSDLNAMEEGASKEEKTSYLKELEKRKKKQLNEIESAENRITRANNDIDQADRDIPKNESEQQVLAGKIAIQELVVQKFTEKFNTVKTY
jgi:hypothetical protein